MDEWGCFLGFVVMALAISIQTPSWDNGFVKGGVAASPPTGVPPLHSVLSLMTDDYSYNYSYNYQLPVQCNISSSVTTLLNSG